MRSVAWAMTWALLRRSPGMLVGAALAANLLPVILLTAIRGIAAVDPRDPALIIIHIAFSQINMFVFAAALLSARGKVSELFAAPITTTTLAIWWLVPAMLLMFAESALSGLMLNFIYGLDWPVIGPALLMAVFLAAVQGMFWLTADSGRMPFAIGAVAAVIGLWHKSRYGDVFSMPNRLWQPLTPLDVAVMIVIGLLSFLVSVVGLARSRRGDRPAPLQVPEWLEDFTWSTGLSANRLTSAESALAWSEWRRKGWVLPVTVLFGMFLGLAAWGVSVREPRELLEGFIAGGGLLSLAGLLGGLAFGNMGRDDSDLAIRQFQATRPVSTRRMARVTLKTLAKSIVLAWGIWMMGLIVAYLVARATGELPQREVLLQGWWFLPLSLLGVWMVGGLAASLGLFGDARFVTRSLVTVFAVGLGGSFLMGLIRSPAARELVGNTMVVLAALACLAGTAWIFAMAHRRGLMDAREIRRCLAGWLLMVAVLVLVGIEFRIGRLPMFFGCGLLALAVAPIPAAPLALARNRTR